MGCQYKNSIIDAAFRGDVMGFADAIAVALDDVERAGSNDRPRWAKVIDNWEPGNANPLRHPFVNVVFGDEDGENLVGEEFDAVIVVSAGMAPNIREGNVILVEQASNKTWLVTGDYADGHLGKIDLWSGAVSTIPGGWALCDGSTVGSGATEITVTDLTGKFVMGIDPDGQADEKDVGDTGGNRDHGGGTNDHSNHAAHDHSTPNHQHAVNNHTHADHVDHVHEFTEISDVASGTGEESVVGQFTTIQKKATSTIGDPLTLTHAEKTDLTTATDGGGTTSTTSAQSHSATDNRPPYYVLAYIQRVY